MISIEIEAICYKCGSELFTTLAVDGGLSDFKVRVRPCPICCKKATPKADSTAYLKTN